MSKQIKGYIIRIFQLEYYISQTILDESDIDREDEARRLNHLSWNQQL